MLIYFDTSVLVAYYTIEDRTDDARDVVAQAELPVVSDLAIVELNVVIERKRQQGFLSAAAAADVFALFDEHLCHVFARVAIDHRHVAATRRLAASSPVSLRALDALHLAIALDVGGAMASFDRRLVDAGRAFHLQTLS